MRHLIVSALVLCASASAFAQSLVMVHSGYLLDAADLPVTATAQAMTFRIYNVKDLRGTGEQLIWESNACNVTVSHGFYSVALGEGCNGATPLAATHVPPSALRFLEVSIGGVSLLPRMLLGAVPNAVVASVALEAKALTLEANAGAGRVLLSDANGAGAWGQVGSAGIADGAIADADVAGGAAIATGKLSGPVMAIANHGLGALATRAAVTDAEVSNDAAIATGKLSGAVTAIANHGLGALATKTSVADADVASGAAIATSKLSGAVTAIANHGLGALATKAAVTDVEVAAGAAIAGSKIRPNFGTQDLVTAGSAAIGASTPEAKLHVSAANTNELAKFENTASSSLLYPAVVLHNYKGTTGGHPYFGMGNFGGTKEAPAATPTGSALAMLIAYGHDGTSMVQAGRLSFTSEGAFGPGANPTGISLSTGINGAYAEAMRIRANGNVGIGTPTPAAKLDVNGTIGATWGTVLREIDMGNAALNGSAAFDIISNNSDGGSTGWAIMSNRAIYVNGSSSGGGHGGNWGRQVYLEAGTYRWMGTHYPTTANTNIHGSTPAANYKFTLPVTFTIAGGNISFKADTTVYGDNTTLPVEGAAFDVTTSQLYQAVYYSDGYAGTKASYIKDLRLVRVR